MSTVLSNKPQRFYTVALLATALGGTFIAVVAALLRRRRKKRSDENDSSSLRPDVLNEAQSLDLALQGSSGRHVQHSTSSTNLLRAESSRDGLDRARSLSSLAGGPGDLIPLTNPTLQQLCFQGNQHLQQAGNIWEEALARAMLEVDTQGSTCEKLRSVISQVRHVEEIYQKLFEADIAIDTAMHALQELDHDYELKHGHSMASDEASYDTFVSAPESADLTDLKEKISDSSHRRQHLYDLGLQELQNNNVPYRKLRTKQVGCESDSEFLAKLFILRQALNGVTESTSNRKWFMNTGKVLITGIMNIAQRDPSDFLFAMEKMETFLEDEAHFEILKIELGYRGVKCFTMYDIVFDWILMDAFEDLTNPPTSVMSVIQNRWLSNGLKETAISTAVWSILKAKRRLLKYHQGFISHFYQISESVSPMLAWAFLGPDCTLKDICYRFKTECECFLVDLFDSRKVRYTEFNELQNDIMALAKERANHLLADLERLSQSSR